MTGLYVPIEYPKWCCNVLVNNAEEEQAVRAAEAAPPAPEPDHPPSPVAIRMRRTRARRREGKRVIPLDVSIAQIEALVAAGSGGADAAICASVRQGVRPGFQGIDATLVI